MPRPAPADPGRTDRGDVLLGWLVRLVVVLGVLAVVAFDLISIGSARLTAQDQAQAAARAAADSWAGAHDPQRAFDSAVESARAADPADRVDPAGFSIDATGHAHLTVSRTARTLVVRRVGPLRHLAAVSVAAVSGPAPA